MFMGGLVSVERDAEAEYSQAEKRRDLDKIKMIRRRSILKIDKRPSGRIRKYKQISSVQLQVCFPQYLSHPLR